MIIETVKINGSGYLVNGNMFVPNDPANRDYADVLAWIAEGNTPAPKFTDAEIAANAQAVINNESLAYLASTDWYVTRKTEIGTEIPSDVSAKRQEARNNIVENA